MGAEKEKSVELCRLIEKMHSGLALLDERGLFTYANDTFCEMLGFTPGEIIGRSATAFQDRKHQKILKEEAEKCRKGQKRQQDLDWIRKDGKKIHTIVSTSPWSDEESACNGLIAVITEITERKRAERALRESKRKYRQLLEHAPVGIHEVDLTTLKFISVNDVACHYTGYSREEFLSMGLTDLLTEGSRREFAERVNSVLSGQKVPSDVIYEVMARGDRKFWVLCNSRITFRNGKPQKATVIVQDITELKQKEDALHRFEEELRILSSRLMSVQEEERKRIARDLHDTVLQKLAYMKMALSLKMRQSARDSQPSESAFLQETIDTLKECIDDIRHTMEDLRPSILDRLGIISTIRTYCQEFKARHPELKLRLETDVREEEIAEEFKIPIFRIVQEALNNIIKHSRAEHATLSLKKREGKLLLQITDDGVGFDPGEKNLHEKSKGGFGLTSMRERCTLSRGVFSLFSEKGCGTTIEATWPVTR